MFFSRYHNWQKSPDRHRQLTGVNTRFFVWLPQVQLAMVHIINPRWQLRLDLSNWLDLSRGFSGSYHSYHKFQLTFNWMSPVLIHGSSNPPSNYRCSNSHNVSVVITESHRKRGVGTVRAGGWPAIFSCTKCVSSQFITILACSWRAELKDTKRKEGRTPVFFWNLKWRMVSIWLVYG